MYVTLTTCSRNLCEKKNIKKRYSQFFLSNLKFINDIYYFDEIFSRRYLKKKMNLIN